jgi:hypothetical protein
MSPTHIRTKEAWASIEHMLELSEHPSTTCASASTRDTPSSLHLFSTHALHLSSCLLSFVSYLVISRRLSLISHRSSFFISHDSSLSHTHTLSLIVRSSLLCSSLLSCVRLDSSSLFHLIASLVLRLISHRLSLFLSLSLISHLIISSFVSLSSHHLVFRLSSLFTLELIIYLPNSSLLRNQASLRRACCVRWGGGGATHHPGHAACA